MTDRVDSSRFRELCGRFATGVVVVTAADGDRPAGMTANSFSSVSLDPPLVSVNVDRVADFHAVILAAPRFTINILAADQEGVSRRFAGQENTDKFAGIGYHRNESGGIVLAGAIGTIECLHEQRIDIGDHTIVVGRVIGGQSADGRPLLYYRGGYRTLE